MTEPKPYRLGADVGGTFTDLVLLDDRSGDLLPLKVPTRRLRLAEGVVAGIEELLLLGHIAPQQLERFIHGTTLATNAVLEGDGAPVGLLVTGGTRDILELGRLRLPDPTNFLGHKPEPLVPRSRVCEVRGRLYADGSQRSELDRADVLAACDLVLRAGASAIAICFLHSYANGDHERRAASIISDAHPELPVSVSSEIWPEQREFERAVVTVMNAMLVDRIQSYLESLEEGLTGIGLTRALLCTKSNGGVMTSQEAGKHPVQLLMSGPAAGVVGAAYIAGMANTTRLLTLDIGGTSADVSLIDGQVGYSNESRVGDYPVLIPTVDVISIGAGGGSIARVDEAGVLKVGPKSAGADPGPAAYGRGGDEPTVTDAYVVSGIIDPSRFLGGTMPLDGNAAHRAIERLGTLTELDPQQTASAILQVATAAMHAKLLPYLASRGMSAAEIPLFAYGGAGPTHAFLLARELGSKVVIVPPHPGALCAIGCLVADLRADFIRSVRVECSEAAIPEITATLTQLAERGRSWLAEQGIAVDQVLESASADMRYAGQSFELNVPLKEVSSSGALRQAFEEVYAATYLHRNPHAAVEIVSLRAHVAGITPKPGTLRPSRPVGTTSPATRRRPVFIDGAWTDCTVVDRYSLGVGDFVDGPAVVEQYDTTVFVPPGFHVSVDEHWNLIGATAE